MSGRRGGLFRGVLRTLERQREREEVDREGARALFLELMREEPRSLPSRLAEDPACASPALAGRLLQAAEQAVPEEPGRAEELAGLALAIAERLTSPWGDLLAAGLAGSAWAWIGDGRRERGDLSGAEEALEEARLRLDPLPTDAPERGLRCRLLARLRHDQERSDEALALAGRALALAAAREDEPEVAAAALDGAWMELAEMEPGEALPLFERAAAFYREPDPVRPWLSARHGLALAAADLQDPLRSEGALRELRRVAPELPELERLRIDRVEADVDQARDRNDEAARSLERIWPALGAQGAVHEALDAGLDLARLYLEAERRGDLDRLRAALLASFPLPAPLAARLAESLEAILRPGLPPLERLGRLEGLQAALRRERHGPTLPSVG